ncbi:MAG TPA: toxin-antitoxin system YwqK family antitoxin [Sedimentisphaerales bacterium]|nr:toxin-antitoxin system YwqK family antitoxin [Sedimentisphaerales bacterium]
MKKKLFLIVLLTTLVLAQIGKCGQVLHETIQSKVRLSDVIVIAQVQNVKPGKILAKQRSQEWHTLCSIQQVLKGDISDKEIPVAFLLPAKGITIVPKPHSLAKGKTYILFLRQSGSSYRLITPYHGDIEVRQEYAVFDEDLKNDKEALKRSASSINGVPSVMLSHDALTEKIQKLMSKEDEALRHNMTIPREPVQDENSGRWSSPVNGLLGHLVVRNKPNKYNETILLDIVLELKNVSTKPIAIKNDQNALSFKLQDLRGYDIPQSGYSKSGPIPYPQWAVIPRDSYWGFSLYDRTVGIPGGEDTFIALPNHVWRLKEGEFILHATLTVKDIGEDRPENAWSGELVLPPLRISVGSSSRVKYGAAPDLLWIEPPKNYNGTWTVWGRNGQKRYEIDFKEGKYHGTFTTLYSNGQECTQQDNRNHKAHGPGRGWHPNGRRSYEITYKDGKPNGTWIHWYDNGQKQSKREYKNGENHGTYTIWHRNGQKQLEINYRDGKKHGIEASWDERGNVHYMRHYENGKVLRQDSHK